METPEAQADQQERHSFIDELVTLWPGIRYLSQGVLLAWVFMAYSGTFWLSDIETDGSALSNMYLISTTTTALVILVAPFFARQFGYMLSSRASLLSTGFLAMVGVVLIILAGPYYIGSVLLFTAGNVMTGIGIGVISLKCGELYGELQPWRALIYSLLSQLLVVVIFFFALGSEVFHPIQGGPSLGGILALMFLPIIAALLLTARPLKQNALDAELPPEPHTTKIRALSPVFWKFLIAVFIFTLTTSIVRGLYTNVSSPSTLLSDTSNLMLLRTFFFATILLVTIRFFKFINFGKPYLLFMGLIAVLVALTPLLPLFNETLTNIVSFSISVFDILIWCLLAFIVFEKRISSVIVFGFGRGIFMAGGTVGWVIGTRVMPQIIGTSFEIMVYIAMAFLILISTTLVFSEKDFDSLFSAISEIELDIDDVSFDLSGDTGRLDKVTDHERPYQAACKNVGALAKLSTREQSILELLAMGRGSENIAKRLSISLNTVRTHTHNIYAKLDVHSRQELISLIESERDRVDKPTG